MAGLDVIVGAVVDGGLVVAADASEDEIVLVVAATIPVKVHRFTHNIATNRNYALIKTIYFALLLFWLLGCDTWTIALFSSKEQR